MNRRFDIPTYKAESSGWNVEKIVNVAAATGPNSVEETIELDRTADANGGPDAIVAGCHRPHRRGRYRPARPADECAALPWCPPHGTAHTTRAPPRRTQGAAGTQSRFRADDPSRPADVRRGRPRPLFRPRRRGRAHRLAAVAADDEFALWKEGIEALAATGDNIVCKLSGLAMPLGSIEPKAFAPWMEHAIEVFGPGRCMFASNFPVDAMAGTFDDLYGAFAAITDGLDLVARDQLFAATAERVYGL